LGDDAADMVEYAEDLEPDEVEDGALQNLET
jgi:hypothetical protein